MSNRPVYTADESDPVFLVELRQRTITKVVNMLVSKATRLSPKDRGSCMTMYDLLRNRLGVSQADYDSFVISLRNAGVYDQVVSQLSSYLPRI